MVDDIDGMIDQRGYINRIHEFNITIEPNEQELEYRRILEEQKRELERINQVGIVIFIEISGKSTETRKEPHDPKWRT